MNYELTDKQKAIREQYEQFCATEIGSRATLLDRASAEEVESLMRENLRTLADQGYMKMFFAEEYGGSNADLITRAIAGEALAKACAATYLSASASVLLCGIPLQLFGSPEQKERSIGKIMNGELIGAFALTEPDAGSDTAGIKTTAVKKNGNWILNGTKTYITNAPIADICIVTAYTEQDAGPENGMSTFIIEKGTPGFTAGDPLDKLGNRGSPTGELFLEDCTVSDDAVLGEVGKGFAQVQQTLDYGKLSTAVASLGIAMACLERAAKYAGERKSSGRPLNRYQEVSFRLADMMIMADVARLLIYRAAWAKDTGDPEASVLISCAKVFASESATQIASMALQVHGGRGYMKDCDVERLYRDAKLGEIDGGTSEIQRLLIAENILDRFAP